MSDTKHAPWQGRLTEKQLLRMENYSPYSRDNLAAAEIRTLRKQRDDLLAACEALLTDWLNLTPTSLSQHQAKIYYSAIAAIAKAKPKGGGQID